MNFNGNYSGNWVATNGAAMKKALNDVAGIGHKIKDMTHYAGDEQFQIVIAFDVALDEAGTTDPQGVANLLTAAAETGMLLCKIQEEFEADGKSPGLLAK